MQFELIDSILYFELYLTLIVIFFTRIRLNIASPALIFACFYTLQIGLAPIVEVLIGRGVPAGINPYIDILLPLAAFYLGYCVAKGIKPSRAKTHQKVSIKIDASFLYIAYWICLLAGVIYVFRTGINPFGSDFNNERIENQTGMGVFLYLNGALIIILPLLYERYLERKIRLRPLIFLIILAIAVFFIRGSRWLCIAPLIMIIILSDMNKPIRKSTLAIGALIGVMFVSVYGALRTGWESNLFNSLINVTCDQVENLSRIYSRFKGLEDYQLGTTFIYNFNIVLPGPGEDYTLWLKELVGASFAGGGMTPSIIGDLYINFGYFGVYGGMFVLGALAVIIERFQDNTRSNLVLAIFLSWEYATLIGGGISNGVLSFTMNIAMYALLKLISKRTSDIEISDKEILVFKK